jgi:predicted house-cleaning noncanonical NTP pyrophosphatase (MazG superfamily)
MQKGDEEKLPRNLYPELSEQESKRAEENLAEYLELALRIHERIHDDPTATAVLQEFLAQRSGRNSDRELRTGKVRAILGRLSKT